MNLVSARIFFALILSLTLLSNQSQAQENYEIQVYASPTLDKGRTMVELHSNYTFKAAGATPGMFSNTNALHETIEITHGWTTWFETGFYIFNEIGGGNRTGYVGSHIRPRVAIPQSWHWPLGLSLYSESTSSLEIRPIIDKEWNKFYVSFNPTIEKSFRGIDSGDGLIFSPNLKGSYDFTKVLTVGFEYYGSTGQVFNSLPLKTQEHQIFLATDLNFSADWEFNAGFGYGLTTSTDRAIFKLILGRRF
jgi:hypothetical protein